LLQVYANYTYKIISAPIKSDGNEGSKGVFAPPELWMELMGARVTNPLDVGGVGFLGGSLPKDP